LATPANGFTVKVGDAAGLAAALTAVAGATSGERREWGANSSDMARSYWPDQWADTLLSAIRWTGADLEELLDDRGHTDIADHGTGAVTSWLWTR
jgi:hypothetical protein